MLVNRFDDQGEDILTRLDQLGIQYELVDDGKFRLLLPIDYSIAILGEGDEVLARVDEKRSTLYFEEEPDRIFKAALGYRLMTELNEGDYASDESD